MSRFLNGSGWLGYVIFAGIGTTLFIYGFLPSVGGIGACFSVTPLFCLSAYLVFHVPLGMIGFAVFSHGLGKHDVKLWVLLLLVLGAFGAGIHPVHAQPVAVFFNARDYYPFIYYVDPPFNVSVTTAVLDEFYVFEFAYFWPYHPVSLPSTCAAALPAYDWELVYVYVSFATQAADAVAYRYHCNWNFIDQTYPGGVIAVPAPGAASINATRPVITFISHYHIPVNDYPLGPRFNSLVKTPGSTEFAGQYSYQQADYNFTTIPQVPPDAHAIDPGFYKGLNWYNIEVFTVAGFSITGIAGILFAFEKRKIAGF